MKESIPDGTPFLLVVIATKVTSDAISDNLDCVLVTGQVLEEF